MNLIRTNENKAVVNLDNVTYIYPIKSTTGGRHSVCFVFDAMNNEELLESVWYFECESRFDSVIDSLKIKDI